VKERYLVTGAAGFIGSHLCERLLNDGHVVRGVDRFSPYYDRSVKHANLSASRRHDAFEFVETDLAEADCDALLSEVDGVFHLAGQPGVRASWGDGFVDYLQDNVVATQRLFEALSRRPLPTVVASSSSVYGDAATLPVSEEEAGLRPVSPYGLTKLTVEHLARMYVEQRGLHVVALRYFTVYGPRQRPDMAFNRFVGQALAGQTLNIFGDGDQSRDFSYVADVVVATVRALRAAPGRVYNVGGGQPTSINDVIHGLELLIGRPVHVIREAAALGDVRHTWADTTRARSELGWQPTTDLAAGLAAQVAWQRSHAEGPSGRLRAADGPSGRLRAASGALATASPNVWAAS
jgi:UDP-glucose 4-epimerase